MTFVVLRGVKARGLLCAHRAPHRYLHCRPQPGPTASLSFTPTSSATTTISCTSKLRLSTSSVSPTPPPPPPPPQPPQTAFSHWFHSTFKSPHDLRIIPQTIFGVSGLAFSFVALYLSVKGFEWAKEHSEQHAHTTHRQVHAIENIAGNVTTNQNTANNNNNNNEPLLMWNDTAHVARHNPHLQQFLSPSEMHGVWLFFGPRNNGKTSLVLQFIRDIQIQKRVAHAYQQQTAPDTQSDEIENGIEIGNEIEYLSAISLENVQNAISKLLLLHKTRNNADDAHDNNMVGKNNVTVPVLVLDGLNIEYVLENPKEFQAMMQLISDVALNRNLLKVVFIANSNSKIHSTLLNHSLFQRKLNQYEIQNDFRELHEIKHFLGKHNIEMIGSPSTTAASEQPSNRDDNKDKELNALETKWLQMMMDITDGRIGSIQNLVPLLKHVPEYVYQMYEVNHSSLKNVCIEELYLNQYKADIIRVFREILNEDEHVSREAICSLIDSGSKLPNYIMQHGFTHESDSNPGNDNNMAVAKKLLQNQMLVVKRIINKTPETQQPRSDVKNENENGNEIKKKTRNSIEYELCYDWESRVLAHIFNNPKFVEEIKLKI